MFVSCVHSTSKQFEQYLKRVITKFLVSYIDKRLVCDINCASTVNFEWFKCLVLDNILRLQKHHVCLPSKKMELTAETSVFKTYEVNFVIYLASLK